MKSWMHLNWYWPVTVVERLTDSNFINRQLVKVPPTFTVGRAFKTSRQTVLTTGSHRLTVIYKCTLYSDISQCNSRRTVDQFCDWKLQVQRITASCKTHRGFQVYFNVKILFVVCVRSFCLCVSVTMQWLNSGKSPKIWMNRPLVKTHRQSRHQRE